MVKDLLSNAETSKLLFKRINSEYLLDHAIKCNEDKIVELLIKNGAPVNMLTLYYCIRNGKFEIFNFLMGMIEDKTLIDKEYHRLFDYAIKYKRHDIIHIILCSIDVNLKDNKNQTFLHHAVKLENLKIVKRLINRGAKLNCVDQNGCTPLNLALKSRNIDITNLLLDKKAEYNCTHMGNKVLVEEDSEFLWPLAESKGLVLKSEQSSGPSINQLNTSLTNDPWVMQEKPNATLQQVRNANLIQMISSV